MLVKCITEFMDLKAHKLREEGETFEVSEDRFKAINSTRYGVLVEEATEEATEGIEDAAEETPEEPTEDEKPKRKRKAKED